MKSQGFDAEKVVPLLWALCGRLFESDPYKNKKALVYTSTKASPHSCRPSVIG
jgi:hypothetical protein